MDRLGREATLDPNMHKQRRHNDGMRRLTGAFREFEPLTLLQLSTNCEYPYRLRTIASADIIPALSLHSS